MNDMARRMAVAGWTAAALVVSGTLTLPSCAGETVAGPDDGGSSTDTGMGPGVCAAQVDSGIDTGIAQVDSGVDTGIDTGYVAGICAQLMDAAADTPVDTGAVAGLCPVMVADSEPPPVGGIC